MWFLGIDIGTTHIKIIGISEEGTFLPVKKCRTPVMQQDGLTFHDASVFWQSLSALIENYSREEARHCGPLGRCVGGHVRPGGVRRG